MDSTSSLQLANYWHSALKLQKLLNTNCYNIDQKAIFITKDDLLRGRLSGPLIDITQALVLPILAINNTSAFLPLILEITLDENGWFIPSSHNTLPIIPSIILQPTALNPIVVGRYNACENYYSNNPPTWYAHGNKPTWQEQLEYGLNLFATVANNHWQTQLTEHGYIIDEYNALLIPTNALVEEENNIAFNDGLIGKLITNHLKKSIPEVQIIQAGRVSGKSTYISALILKDWLLSAIHSTLPKSNVWLPIAQLNIERYTNIFDCYNDSQTWLTSSIRQEIFNPAIHSDFSVSYCIQDFLSLLSNYLQQDILHLEHAQETILSALRQDYAKSLEGQSLLDAWAEVIRVVEAKYQDKGGVHNRIKNLKHALGVAQHEMRHLHGLVAIWERLLANARKLPSWFDSIKLLNYFKNRKLYKFYAQYFPQDNVALLAPQSMNAKLNGRVQALKNKEHLINDLLHQASNDLLQLDAVRLKCKQWFNDNYKFHVADYQHTENYLNNEINNKLNFLVLKYYEIIVLENFAWSKNENLYSKYFIAGKVENIETLYIEHANHIAILDALPLLNKAQQLVMLGDNEHINSSYYPKELDLELCKFNNLIKDDLDFEYLKSKGVLGSVNNLWQFVTKYLNIEKSLPPMPYNKPAVQYVKVLTSKQEYLGSKYNSNEVDAVYNLLLELESSSEIKDIMIYTAFAGQAKKIALKLEGTLFNNLKIKLLQQTNFQISKIAIVAIGALSIDDPLYAVNVKLLENIIPNTTEKLVIICNEKHFSEQDATMIQQAVISHN